MAATNLQLHRITLLQVLNDYSVCSTTTTTNNYYKQLPIAVGRFTFSYKRFVKKKNNKVGTNICPLARALLVDTRFQVKCPIRPVLLSHASYLTAEYTNYM